MLEPKLDLSWDQSHFYIDAKPFYLKIFEGEDPPKSFNSVLIKLDAEAQDSLNWDEQIKRAAHLSRDFYILWHLDLGMNSPEFCFNNLLKRKCCELALQHFTKTIWPQFKEKTIGICLYKGSIGGKNKEILFDKYLYHLEELSHTLSHLAQFLVDEIPICLFFDVSKSFSCTELVRLFDFERFEHFLLGIKGTSLPFSGLCWEKGLSTLGYLSRKNHNRKEKETVGFLVPPSGDLEKVFQDLQPFNYRLLYQDFAVLHWDQLDEIIVLSQYFDHKIERLIQGFQAAGGKVVVYGDSLGLKEEINFHDYLTDVTSP